MFLILGTFGFIAPAWSHTQAPVLTGPDARAAIGDILTSPAFSSSLSASGVFAVLGSVAALAALALMVRAQANRQAMDNLNAPLCSPLPVPGVDAQALLEAQALWPQAKVQAVERLYGGLLARLQSDYQLRIDSADTEADILTHVVNLRLSGLEDFSQRLTHAWLHARYADQAPTEPAWASLCDGWRRLFPSDDRV